ncbi:MAG: recombination mediator RecR [Oscillospiraceae bacterium]
MRYKLEPLENLVDQFERLPGIGRKTAQRLAFFVLNEKNKYAENFSKAIIDAKKTIRKCIKCQNLTDKEICFICEDEKRDKTVICVVEDAKDVSAFERTGEYNGLYHILNGLISPMNGVGVEELSIKDLLIRVSEMDIKEIIMATNPTIEGEATSMYISRILKPFEVKVTRLAYGIPVGGNLEFADEVTLFKALEGRSII